MHAVLNIPDLLANAMEARSDHDHDEMERAISVIAGNDSHALRALHVRGPDDNAAYGTRPCASHVGLSAAKLFLENFPQAQMFVQLNPAVHTDTDRNDEIEFERLAPGCQLQIGRRKWFFVDIDPVRAPDTNSTEFELSRAAAVTQRVVGYLRAAGWAEPIVALSGNGVHLLFRVDLPADETATDLVRRCLRKLASQFRTEDVVIDRQVFDLSRLTRMYGSVNRKGTSSPERPQRLSALLFVPETISITARSLLEQLTRDVCQGSKQTERAKQLLIYPRISMQDLLDLLEDVRCSGNGWIACCPAHCDSTPSLSINERFDGTILLYCHAGCEFDVIVKRMGLRPSQLFGKGHDSRTAFHHTPREEYATNDELAKYASYCQSTMSSECLTFLANQLGVAPWALQQIGVGWSESFRAWTIPERRSDGGVIGIQLRDSNGDKYFIRGGHRGLILPHYWWTWKGNVLVPEGASDVATCLSRGIPAIGRPAAATAPGLAKLLADTPEIVPIVFGENDRKHEGSWPGFDGANSVARQLAGVLGRDISVAFPPAPHKDIRDFFLSTQGLSK